MTEPELTPEVHDAIIALVRAGNHPETASAVYGTTMEIFFRWMDLAEAKIEPYARLKADFEKYREEMQNERIKIMRKVHEEINRDVGA